MDYFILAPELLSYLYLAVAVYMLRDERNANFIIQVSQGDL